MLFSDLKKIAYALYRPILWLEDVYPYEKRQLASSWLTLFTVLFFLLALLATVFQGEAVALALPVLGSMALLAPKFYGIFFLLLAVRFVYTGLEAFHRSYYYRGLNLILDEYRSDNQVAVSFEVAAILHYSDEADLVRGFLNSSFGQDTMLRLGIEQADIDSFLLGRRTPLGATGLVIDRETTGVTLPVYAASLLKADEEWRAWLFTQKIQKAELIGASGWVMRTNRWLRNKERWYSRDMLGRIEGIGKSFSFGERFTLEKYGHYVQHDPIYQSAIERSKDEDTDVEAIEAELVRTRQANALLVGKELSSIREIVAQLAHKIHDGLVLPPIEHKRLFLFDIRSLISANQNKSQIEQTLKKALTESVHAGDLILVIEDYPAVIKDCASVEVDITGILEPYFSSPEIQLLLTATETGLHRDVERDQRLKQNFETIRLHEVDQTGLLQILAQRSLRLEKRYPVIVTYQALQVTVTDAHRYFSDGVLADKALDLLEESVVATTTAGQEFVTEDLVTQVVEAKTGIPLGEVGADESEKLLHLEETLQSRVIGQTAAVSAIAGTMRRARAGINDPDRPIGTFLFLGPTGVGKTETAKALANSFFGSDEAMHRLDMSEYSTADAINRLIGFPDGTPGRLVTMLKEAPYRLLLLDEFEKATQAVHDLFLQILDEGEFADSDGNKVNARNTILIATSNAGAELLHQALQAGDAIAELHDEILNHIIEAGTFRPELLNRFDGVIMFEPLQHSEAEQISRLSLEALAERLREKGLDLSVTDELVQYVATEGYDQRFGGRNLNRFIKEHIEQAIADKIIAGEVVRGETIVLAMDEFQ